MCYNFISLGTMDMTFYRIPKAVDEYTTSTEEIVLQTGYTDYQYKKNFRLCIKNVMQNYIDKADILYL